ncbi:MAG: SpoIIE family protein phosphatase [Microscillaceae bacterium]|nr:SpoIIE family protein phosphatase [Microscillaceae bacterium]
MQKVQFRLEAYDFRFSQLVAAVRNRGYKDFGLEGEMRRCVHDLENRMLPNTGIILLNIRRWEKDFIHCKEKIYKERVLQLVDSLMAQPLSAYANEESKRSFGKLLALYRDKFLSLAEAEENIGLTQQTGLRGQIDKLSTKVQQVIELVNEQINQKTERLTTRLKSTLILLLFVFVGLSSLLIYITIEKMGQPINRLSESIKAVISHNFSEQVSLYRPAGRDEIAGISRDFHAIIERVKARTREITQQKEQIAQAYQNLKLLGEIGQEITSQLNIPEIIRVVSQKVNNLMDTAVFAIGTHNPERKSIDFLGEQGPASGLISSREYLQDAQSLAVYCFLQKNEVLINDFERESQRYIKQLPEVDIPPCTSQIFVPLILLDECIGVVTVQSYRKNAYQSFHLDILRNMANYIAVALENADIYQKLHQKNKKLIDSISYAQRIQEAILPNPKAIQEALPESFILFKPRDLVSGDFYWFAQTEPKPIYEEISEGTSSIRSEFRGFQTPKTVMAVIDCTGHGIPGAFMSMVGNDLLDSIVLENNITHPDEVLNRMHQGIRKVMRQKKNENPDGMDIALCTIDFEKGLLEYAGAFSPLVLIQNGEMQVIRPDKKPVGVWYRQDEVRAYTRHVIKLDAPTTIYIHSDGFPDQLGGPRRRKFLSKRLHRLFYEIHRKPMFEQKHILEKRLAEWIGEGSQNDDILIVGFHIRPLHDYDDINLDQII